MKAIRRPLFWYRFVMWIVSIIFASLLISLGALIMSDVPTAGNRVTLEDFVDSEQLDDIEAQQSELNAQIDETRDRLEISEFILTTRSADYQNQRASFENWVQTRTATGSSEQDPEVVKRVNQIETLKAAEREAEREVEGLQLDLLEKEQSLRDLRGQESDVRRAAYIPYEKAERAEVLKVFLLRLALTLPLLVVSGWLIAKKRESSYWPLYRGFVLFSLFAFFVELVPYLPSYGGYVRIGVGLLIAVGFAHFVIRGMTRYLQNKQLEEQQPEDEKRKLIAYEDAVSKISDGICPSCDRAYAAKPSGTKGKVEPVTDVDFCVHCGFCLYTNCNNCGRRDNSFYKFCGSCGTPSDANVTADSA